MSIGSVFHKIVNGIHHLFVSSQHAVEQVQVFIEGRPGLKKDLDTLLGPVKDAVVSELTAKYEELKASSPDQAVALVKAEIPAVLATVKQTFLAQATHAGSLDLLLSLAANAFLALVG